jgi:hypothetical protein
LEDKKDQSVDIEIANDIEEEPKKVNVTHSYLMKLD